MRASKILYPIYLLIAIIICVELGLRISAKFETTTERLDNFYWTSFGKSYNIDWALLHGPNGYTDNNSEGEFSYSCPTNEIGLVGKKMDIQAKFKKKVFIVGDSFVEGIGADCPHSMPAHLDSILSPIYPDLAVFNAGRAGSDIFFAEKVISRILIEHHPTHIIAVVNHSDVGEVIIKGGEERFYDNDMVRHTKPDISLPLYRYFHIYRFYTHAVRGLDTEHFLTETGLDVAINRSEKKICDKLGDIERFCSENQIKFMAVMQTLPWAIILESDLLPGETIRTGNMRSSLSGIADCLSSNNTSYIELAASMRRVRDSLSAPVFRDRFLYEIDGHFNGEGYELLANLIYHELNTVDPGFWD